MSVLQNMEPSAVFHYFEEICRIPHTSFHEKQLSDYCVAFAKERGLYCEQDDLGNVIIIKDATEGYEEIEPIILQGHLDMVGDKAPDCEIDLETDSLRLGIDGDWIYAEGTTLGGDDGIAVAYGLALLDAKDIPHPRLEVVFTVSEEVGLLGANGIDLSCCQAKRLLNVDSEEEGIFTVGCAGGMRLQADLPVKRVPDSGLCLDFQFQGILGGHSGIEINNGLANANVLCGRFFLMLKKACDFNIITLNGGVKENVIPKDAGFSLLIEPADLSIVEDTVADFNAQIGTEYAAADPNASLVMAGAGIFDAFVLDQESKERTITALNLMPNGVQAMCIDLPGLVETSLNLGIVKLTETDLSLCFSIRSSVASAKAALADKVTHFAEYLGGSVSISGEYPAWPLARESKFRDQCIAVYKELYKEEPQVVTIHAGLECGILSEKIPGLDCISIGPNLKDIHTIKERASISSIARVWEFIKVVLAYR